MGCVKEELKCDREAGEPPVNAPDHTSAGRSSDPHLESSGNRGPRVPEGGDTIIPLYWPTWRVCECELLCLFPEQGNLCLQARH